MGFDPFLAVSTYDDSAVACDPVKAPEHLVIGKTGTALPGCGHTDQQVEHTAKAIALTVANQKSGDLSTDFNDMSYGRLKNKVKRCFESDTARVFKEVRDCKQKLLVPCDATADDKDKSARELNIAHHAEMLLTARMLTPVGTVFHIGTSTTRGW
jgi:hypothetical protein